MSIHQEIHSYMARELLQGDGVDLTDSTPLLELGILDSFSTLKLVAWIESQYSIKIGAEDVTGENFATIDSIAGLTNRYIAAQKGT